MVDDLSPLHLDACCQPSGLRHMQASSKVSGLVSHIGWACICSGWAGSTAVHAACRHSKASAEQPQAAGRPGPSQVLYVVSMARSLLEAKQDGRGCPAVDVTQVACAAAQVYRLTRQVGGSRRSFCSILMPLQSVAILRGASSLPQFRQFQACQVRLVPGCHRSSSGC